MSCQLNVKSPCSNEEDQILTCQLDWTVRQVKENIQNVWNNHPRPEDQRLVYVGKLMENEDVLKNILRVDEEITSYTIHLVCKVNNEGLRQRIKQPIKKPQQTQSRPTEIPQQQQQYVPQQMAQQPSSFHYGQNYDQHAYWMHQMYAQYMNQYMQYLQYHQQHGTGAFPQMPSSVPTMTPPPAANTAPAAVNAVHQPPPAVADAAAAAPAPDNQPLQRMMNGIGGGGMAAQAEDDEEGEGGRDLLDWLYVGCRVVVVFSMVYFYSSFSRFIMVSLLAFMMYLHHVYFRRNLAAPNQNAADIFRNDNNNNNEIIRQQVDEVRQAAGGGPLPVNNNESEDNTDNGEERPATDNQPEVQQPEPLTGFRYAEHVVDSIWNFISAFFVSLVPEANNYA